MADVVVSNEGERILLGRALGKVVYDPLQPDRLCVYVNDYTPDRDVTLTNLTEGAWSGYVRHDLVAGDWTTPATVDGQAVAWYTPAPVSFVVSSGTVTAYGYFVVDYTGTQLMWVQRFDSVQFANATTPVVVRPALGARSQSEPLPP